MNEREQIPLYVIGLGLAYHFLVAVPKTYIIRAVCSHRHLEPVYDHDVFVGVRCLSCKKVAPPQA